MRELHLRACRSFGLERALVPTGFPHGNRRPPSCGRHRADRRRRALPGAQAGQVRRRARRDSPRSASHGGCDGFRSRPSPALGREERWTRRGRRGSDLRAAQAPRGSGVRRERRVGRRVLVSHGPQTAIGHDMGSGEIARTTSSCSTSSRSIASRRVMRTSLVRSWSATSPTRFASSTALPRGARTRGRRSQAGRGRQARSTASSPTSSRSGASRPSSRRTRERCSRTASTTASAMESASRCTSPRAWDARRGARCGRRDHSRARPLPPRFRRSAGRGSPARHRGRVRASDRLPLRPGSGNVSQYAGAERDQAIETLLAEERRYPPPEDFAEQANAQAGHLRRPVRGVLGAGGARAGDVVRAVHVPARVGASLREVVPRREDQRRLQLPRPPRRGGARREGRVLLRGGARRRAGGDHVCPAARGGRQGRERAEGARRGQGHAGRHLHGHGPGPAGGDARVRAPRRAAHGRLRRLLGRGARRPAERHALRDPPHAGRGLAPRTDGAAQGKRGRGARVVSGCEEGRRRPADARRRSR